MAEDWKYQISLALPDSIPDSVISEIYDIVDAAIAKEDTDYYLIFCDICGVAAERVLVEDEWQCCGPGHPR